MVDDDIIVELDGVDQVGEDPEALSAGGEIDIG